MTFAATIKNCFISTPHTFLSSNTIHTSYSTDRLLDIRPRSIMDQGNMGRLILSFLMMLLLAVEIQATIVLTPAPQPQPPNTFSMYGATPGSLHPQGKILGHMSRTHSHIRELGNAYQGVIEFPLEQLAIGSTHICSLSESMIDITIECGTRCTTRCSKTAFKKPCMFFCQKCCAKCLCVPPGTYGNKQLCPCYNNWKTKRGGPKCP